MICYKDKTWCSQSHLCANYNCPRNLTVEEKKKAVEWWGNDKFPVSLSNMKSETCGYVDNQV